MEILDKSAKITKRKLSIYNLQNNTEYKLIDLGIRLIDNKTYYYGVEYNEKVKLPYNSFYKMNYDLLINYIKIFIIHSKKIYVNGSDVEMIVNDLNEALITIDHINEIISLKGSFIQTLHSYDISLEVIPFLLKEELSINYEHEIIY
jgi:hypothetical protein